MNRVLAICLLLLPLAGHTADVRGLWVGYYAYGPGQRVEAALALEQVEAHVAGMMIERQTFGDQLMPGLPSELINGKLAEDMLTFEKRYFHKEEGNAVVYRLVVSTDGNMLTGFWSVDGAQGTATFWRMNAATMDK